jgi:hypothetical protein
MQTWHPGTHAFAEGGIELCESQIGLEVTEDLAVFDCLGWGGLELTVQLRLVLDSSVQPRPALHSLLGPGHP